MGLQSHVGENSNCPHTGWALMGLQAAWFCILVFLANHCHTCHYHVILPFKSCQTREAHQRTGTVYSLVSNLSIVPNPSKSGLSQQSALPSKQEDPSSSLRSHMEKPGVHVHACEPSPGNSASLAYLENFSKHKMVAPVEWHSRLTSYLHTHGASPHHYHTHTHSHRESLR